MPAINRPLNQKAQTVQFPDEGQPWGALNRFDPFGRCSIADQEFFDLVNYLPMGLIVRQTPADSSLVVALPGGATVTWMRAETLKGGVYLFVLGSDGALYQVQAAGGSIVKISGATVFSQFVDIANWQGQKIIFTDANAAKTYSWDSTTFSLETNLNGIPATCLAVFSQRLWMAFNNTITVTQGGTYNSLGGDSASFQIIDEDATQAIHALYAFNGLLYVFGPNYIQIIANLITAGSPAQLTFTKNTISAEIGTVTRWSIIGYGANIFFACTYGIHTMSGAVPQKLSNQVDGFPNVYGTNSSLSVAYLSVYSTPILAWSVQVAGETAPSLVCIIPTIANTFTGITSTTGGWFRHQDVGTKFVTSEVWNDNPSGWGTDGTNIYRLMTDLGSVVTSTFKTKLWNMGTSLVFKAFLKYGLILSPSGTAYGTLSFVDDTMTSVGTLPFDVSQGYIWIDVQGNAYEWDDSTPGIYTWLALGPPTYQPIQANLDFPPTRLLAVECTLNGIGDALIRHEVHYEMTTADWGD